MRTFPLVVLLALRHLPGGSSRVFGILGRIDAIRSLAFPCVGLLLLTIQTTGRC